MEKFDSLYDWFPNFSYFYGGLRSFDDGIPDKSSRIGETFVNLVLEDEFLLKKI